MPKAPTTPPAVPSTAPATKPARRPARAIHIDAGTVASAVPRNIEAIGAVAHRGSVAIWLPASPPTVITRTETV